MARQSNHDRAVMLCDLLHSACDLLELDDSLDPATRAELQLGLDLALVSALRWRAAAKAQMDRAN